MRRVNPELIDPRATTLRMWLGLAGISDCRLWAMLPLGFLALGIYEHHRWYGHANAKDSPFGELPHVVVLARAFSDTWIKAQLDLTCDLYELVLQIAFMLARRDGARFLLKNRSLRVELIQRIKERGVERLPCWREVKKLPELSRTLFRLGTERVLESSLEKSVEQRGWAGQDNLLVALADEDLAWHIGWLMHSWLVQHGLAPPVEGAHTPPVRPKYTYVESPSSHTAFIPLALTHSRTLSLHSRSTQGRHERGTRGAAPPSNHDAHYAVRDCRARAHCHRRAGRWRGGLQVVASFRYRA
jgi:hypothetical protein